MTSEELAAYGIEDETLLTGALAKELIARAETAEREACAQLIEAAATVWRGDGLINEAEIGEDLAKGIRARKDQP